MKKYNFTKAKQLIDKHKDNLESASLGMHEDWFWTAETVWENGKYKRELPDNADKLQEEFLEARKNGMRIFNEKQEGEEIASVSQEYKDKSAHCIAGIYESYWATPTLQLCFKDGTERMIPCHDGGETTGNSPIELGVLSKSVQENITPLEEE